MHSQTFHYKDSTSYRSNVMRLAYLSADRIELQFASEELARSMSESTADAEEMHSFLAEISTMHPELRKTGDIVPKQMTQTLPHVCRAGRARVHARSSAGNIS